MLQVYYFLPGMELESVPIGLMYVISLTAHEAAISAFFAVCTSSPKICHSPPKSRSMHVPRKSRFLIDVFVTEIRVDSFKE